MILMPTNEPPRSNHTRSSPFVAAFGLFFILELIIGFVSLRMYQNLNQKRENEFFRRTNIVTEKLTSQINDLDFLFTSVRSFYMASTEVTPQEFTDYLNTLLPDPHRSSVYNFTYAEFDPQKNCYQAKIHLVSTASPNSPLIAADPTIRNQQLCLTPSLTSAINQANTKNNTILSEPYLVEGEPHFLLVTPVGNESISTESATQGVVLSSAPSQVFFDDLLSQVSVGDITLNVTDDDLTLFSVFLGEYNQIGTSPYFREQSLGLMNQTWKLRFTSLPGFSLGLEEELFPFMILIGSSILNLLVCFIVYWLAGNNERVRRSAERITADLRASRAQFQAIYQNAPIAYLLLDSKAQIIDSNQTTSALLGFSSAELIGQNFVSLLAVSAPDRQLIQTKLASNSHYTAVSQFRRRDQGLIWGKFSAATVSYPSTPTTFLITITDIDTQKKLEAELQQNAVKLEKINQTLVGRELKMVELKQKLKNSP